MLCVDAPTARLLHCSHITILFVYICAAALDRDGGSMHMTSDLFRFTHLILLALLFFALVIPFVLKLRAVNHGLHIAF